MSSGELTARGFVILGAIVVAGGVAMVSIPAGVIVAGLFLVGLGLLAIDVEGDD